jgi:hypothetical protein
VSFYASFLDSVKSSEVLQKVAFVREIREIESFVKTLELTWKEHQIPTLFPIVCNKEYLEEQYLFMLVLYKTPLNQDNTIGQAALSLLGCLDTPKDFSVELLNKGKVVGVLKGTITVQRV